MRLAGTCSRYSKSAMPQLANAATYHGRDDKLRRWAYQANVMKTFEAMRRQTVTRIVRIDTDGNAGARRQSNAVRDRSFTAAAKSTTGKSRQPGGSDVFTSTMSRMCAIKLLKRAKNPGSAPPSCGFA